MVRRNTGPEYNASISSQVDELVSDLNGKKVEQTTLNNSVSTFNFRQEEVDKLKQLGVLDDELSKEVDKLLQLKQENLGKFYANKEGVRVKIDQAFKIKIEALLNGIVNSSSSAIESKPKPKTSNSGPQNTQDNLDAPMGRGSSVNPPSTPSSTPQVQSSSPNESVGNINVKDLELIEAYVKFKGENKGNGKFFIEYLKFLKKILSSGDIVDKQVVVKRTFENLLNDVKKVIKNYLKTGKIDINSNVIDNYKKSIEDLRKKTKQDLKEAKESIYTNIDESGENSADIFGYRISFNSELKKSLEEIKEIEDLNSNEKIKEKGKRLKLNSLYSIDKLNENWYTEDVKSLAKSLIEDNWNYFSNHYKDENDNYITDKDVIALKFLKELNIETKKQLEKSFYDLKKQLENGNNEHILKIPGTDKTIYFKNSLDRNKAIISTMLLYKGLLEDPEGVLGHVLHGFVSFPGMYRDFVSFGLPTLFESDAGKTIAGLIGLLYIYLSANRRGNILVEGLKKIKIVGRGIEKIGATPYLDKSFEEYKRLKETNLDSLEDEEKRRIKNKIQSLEEEHPEYERHLEIINKRKADLDILINNAKTENTKKLFEEFKRKNLLLKIDTPIYDRKLKDIILIADALDNKKLIGKIRNNFLVKIGRDIIYKMTNLGLGDLIEYYTSGESKFRVFKNIIRQMGLNYDFKIFGKEFKIKLGGDRGRDLIKNNKEFIAERINKIVNKNVEKIENSETKDILKRYLSQDLDNEKVTNIKESISKILEIQEELKNFPHDDIKGVVNEIIKDYINNDEFKENFRIEDPRIKTEFLEELPKVKEILSHNSNLNLKELLIEGLKTPEGQEGSRIIDMIYEKLEILKKIGGNTNIKSVFDSIGKDKILDALGRLEKYFKDIENIEPEKVFEFDTNGRKVEKIIKTKEKVEEEKLEKLIEDLKKLRDISNSTRPTQSPNEGREERTQSTNTQQQENPSQESQTQETQERPENSEGEEVKESGEMTYEEFNKFVDEVELLKAIYPDEFENIKIEELMFEDNPKEFVKTETGFEFENLVENQKVELLVKRTLGLDSIKELFENDGRIIKEEFLRGARKSEFERFKDFLKKGLKEGRI